MALMQQIAVNVAICSGCRVAVVPKTKADGGIAFPFALVHSVTPRTKRDVCHKYGYPAPAAPAPKPLTREERRRIRWDARIDAQNARYAAERAAAEAAFPNGYDEDRDGEFEANEAYQARLAADVGDEVPEPVWS